MVSRWNIRCAATATCNKGQTGEHQEAASLHWLTPSSSTSKIRVAFGGITPGVAALAVGQMSWYDQLASTADFHRRHAFVPAHRLPPDDQW
ncbi:MAG: hypothetical protein QM758_13995 [Armatimonas sp.]